MEIKKLQLIFYWKSMGSLSDTGKQFLKVKPGAEGGGSRL